MKAPLPANLNQQRFDIVARATNDAVWDWDLVTNSLWWNENFHTLFHYTVEEIEPGAESWYTRIHPEDFKRVKAGITQALETGEQKWSDEYRFRRKDGSFADIFDRGYVMRDEAGKPVRMIGAMMDISERKRVEEALRDSEMRLHAVWETAHDAMRLSDENGVVVAVNSAYCKLFGMERSEVEGQPFTVIYASNREPGELQRRYRERFRNRLIVEQEDRRMVLRQGQTVDLEITSTFIELPGRSALLLGLFRDITERKRGEETLRETGRFLEKAQEVGHVGSWLSDLGQTRKLIWSAETCRIFGFQPEEFDGKLETFYSLLHPDDRAGVELAVRLALTGTAPYNHQHRIVRRDGSIRWVHEQADIERNPKGEPIRMVGVVQDITDRRYLEEQLRQSQKMEAIGQLAGGVAHDFNNLLTVIQGHASLLMLEETKSKEGADSIQQIAHAAERAANLTRQLLAFSRKQVMRSKDLDLNEIVTDMTKMLNRTLGEHIKLQVEFGANLPLVHADPGMMEQVVLNLAVNARDAMPKGGLLVIRNSVESIDAEFVRQNPEASPGQFVCLGVTDTGCGIAPENLSRIFEPFFTTKDVGKGTGLGLATVYGIVKQHHGWIKVQSELERGTTFQIFLPASYGVRRSGETSFFEKSVRGGTETLLIVEDETTLRQLTRLILERYGYTVLEAAHGMDALEVWREYQHQIDLVLTDMVMPEGLSGMDLAGKLLIENPETKIIFSSGYSVEVFGKDLELKDWINFLQKPYHPRKLAQAVRECLDGG